MLDNPLPGMAVYWPFIVLASILIISLSRNYFNKGLNKYPGPFLAAYTDVWRFVSVWRGKPQFTLRGLHDHHGDVVRVGPNSLSFSNPAAVKAIYGLNNRLTKVRHVSISVEKFINE